MGNGKEKDKSVDRKNVKRGRRWRWRTRGKGSWRWRKRKRRRWRWKRRKKKRNKRRKRKVERTAAAEGAGALPTEEAVTMKTKRQRGVLNGGKNSNKIKLTVLVQNNRF